jgi:lanthanide-dependent methanol dehydrogenase
MQPTHWPSGSGGNLRPRKSAAVSTALLLAGSVLIARAAEDGQWIMPSKDYANTRFSGLDQINTQNVKGLKVAWTFSTGVNRGQEAAPIVVSNTMYVVTPYPNHVFALDLTNSGAVKWTYEPRPAAAAQGVACCDVVNRECTYDDGRIFFNTLDVFTIALDARTGKELWKTRLGDIQTGETITMPPWWRRGRCSSAIAAASTARRCA